MKLYALREKNSKTHFISFSTEVSSYDDYSTDIVYTLESYSEFNNEIFVTSDRNILENFLNEEKIPKYNADFDSPTYEFSKSYFKNLEIVELIVK